MKLRATSAPWTSLLLAAGMVAGCAGPGTLPESAVPPAPATGAPSASPAESPLPSLEAVSTPEAQEAIEPEPSAPAALTPEPAKRVPVMAEELVRGPAGVAQLSLVVNAGAGFEIATEILDVFASRGVRTTFFLLGWWAERHPEVVRRIWEEGHEVASHGHSVFDLTSVSDAEVVADLERADAAISATTGRSTRPLWSPSAGYRDARVRAIAASLGYRPIYWSQDSGDWRTDATADAVYRRALAGVQNGAIIVLHLDSPHSRTATAAVLADLIDAIRARGVEPVTITELAGE